MKVTKSNQHQLNLFEQQPAQEIQTWQPVRDDFNFCRLALFAAADKRADRFRDIKQHYTVEGWQRFVPNPATFLVTSGLVPQLA
jgi:hypothetical protein